MPASLSRFLANDIPFDLGTNARVIFPTQEPMDAKASLVGKLPVQGVTLKLTAGHFPITSQRRRYGKQPVVAIAPTHQTNKERKTI